MIRVPICCIANTKTMLLVFLFRIFCGPASEETGAADRWSCRAAIGRMRVGSWAFLFRADVCGTGGDQAVALRGSRDVGRGSRSRFRDPALKGSLKGLRADRCGKHYASALLFGRSLKTAKRRHGLGLQAVPLHFGKDDRNVKAGCDRVRQYGYRHRSGCCCRI